jgi:aspartyl/asparaginyl beta-hydroxylase (cupin superfamily)
MGPGSLGTAATLHIARRLLKVRQDLYYRVAGGETRPVFHDVDAVCPELRRIDRNLELIRTEVRSVLPQRHRLPRYHEAVPAQAGISDTGGDWRVLFLLLRYPDVPLSNASLCPRTTELVRHIPGVLMAFVSILEPGKSVPAHTGPSFSYLRYHTALEVPRRNPPELRVKDRHYTWKVGESLLFDDSWEHEVHNQSDEARVSLVVDVLRPAPWYVRSLGGLGLRLNARALGRRRWASVDQLLRMRDV